MLAKLLFNVRKLVTSYQQCGHNTQMLLQMQSRQRVWDKHCSPTSRLQNQLQSWILWFHLNKSLSIMNSLCRSVTLSPQLCVRARLMIFTLSLAWISAPFLISTSMIWMFPQPAAIRRGGVPCCHEHTHCDRCVIFLLLSILLSSHSPPLLFLL